MDRTISLVALIPAMIAVTPAAAQAVVGSPPQATIIAAAPVADASVEVAEAPRARTVRIAGRTVAVDSLPASDDAKPAPDPAEPQRRAHR